MKVESSPDSSIGSVAGGPQKAAQNPVAGAAAAEPAAAAAGRPAAGVQVTLSAATQSATSAGGGDVFNAEKVAAMKLAIDNGTFQVNPEAIADKLLANAAEMLQSSKG